MKTFIITIDSIMWLKDNILHCDNGPAVEWNDGYKFWYQNGKRHRVDGPAVEFTNEQHWWYNNKLVSGKCQFFLNGNLYSEEDYYNHIGKI